MKDSGIIADSKLNTVNLGGGKLKYSIITPVYNREDCIGRCLKSVADNLKWCNAFEHIVVDDGSIDNTPQIVEQFASKHTHIKFIKFEHNRGTNAARNAAIAMATGEFCIILDSDDRFVPNALKIIEDVVNNNNFIHYLFTSDDLKPSHDANYLLKNHYQRVVSFVDFLSGCLNVGFIHVIKTTTMKAHPFDEQLRIHEGVFFLTFFKEAQNLLYTKEIVTIRERGRNDSVTYGSIRTSKEIILRKIIVDELNLKLFLNDYITYGLLHELNKIYLELVDNNLLLSRYKDSKRYMSALAKCNGKNPLFQHVVYCLRLGFVYHILLRIYLFIKYNILKKRLR